MERSSQTPTSAAGDRLVGSLGLTPKDCHLAALPLFHITGLGLSLATLQAGGSNAILEAFDPAQASRTIDEHGDSVSYEFLSELNPSWLIVIDRDAAIGSEGDSAQVLLDNDLVNATTAAQQDAILYPTPDSWYVALGGLTAVGNTYDDVQSLVG